MCTCCSDNPEIDHSLARLQKTHKSFELRLEFNLVIFLLNAMQFVIEFCILKKNPRIQILPTNVAKSNKCKVITPVAVILVLHIL